MYTRLTLGCSVLLVLATVACRKRTPVQEVSLGQSGVEVVARDLGPLGDQWPQWRGPRGDGVAVNQELPTRWTKEQNVRWRVDVPGRGHSSPIVINGLVVLATAEDREQKQSVVAYDEETGELKWKTLVHEGGFPRSNEVHRKATNANGTVASDGELLITSFLNSNKVFVTALDLEGNQVWQREIGAFVSKFGYAPSPTIYKSLVIVVADNSGGGYLAALDIKSGELAWRVSRGDASSYSSPYVATVGGVDHVLLTGGDRMASYDPASGELFWETTCISEATCGTVISVNDRVFASGGYPDKQTVCVDAEGNLLWSNRVKAYEPSMVVAGQQVVGITDNGIAVCWDIADGTQRWLHRIGGNFSSSPVVCNGNIYVIDLAGVCHVFQADENGFESIAENPTGDDGYASPAIAGGSLYFRVGVGDGKDRQEQLVRISVDTVDNP